MIKTNYGQNRTCSKPPRSSAVSASLFIGNSTSLLPVNSASTLTTEDFPLQLEPTYATKIWEQNDYLFHYTKRFTQIHVYHPYVQKKCWDTFNKVYPWSLRQQFHTRIESHPMFIQVRTASRNGIWLCRTSSTCASDKALWKFPLGKVEYPTCEYINGKCTMIHTVYRSKQYIWYRFKHVQFFMHRQDWSCSYLH